MTKVLIIGSNGFIGRHFMKFSRFKESGEISLLETEPENIDFTGYDVVLHLAAIVHQSRSIPEAEYFRVNRDLCLRVAEAAKKAGVAQFVFMSTLKVYGDKSPVPDLRNELSECFPDDPYGKSKFAAEKGLKLLENEKFVVSIIRTPLVYGEGVKANMYSLIRLVDRFPVLPFAGINNKRNFTFVGNLIAYIDRIIEKRASGVYIAMDDKAQSTTELVNLIIKYLNKRVYLLRLPALVLRFSGIFIPEIQNRLFGSLEFENDKTRFELNFEPPYSTEEGIEKMVNYYLTNKIT
jgi:nucleoside-diphosphate-sugar epimerase